MKIGIAGPILTSPFLKYLKDLNGKRIPIGLGGIPVVHIMTELIGRGREIIVFSLAKEIEDELILEGDGIKICIGPYRPRARSRAIDLFSQERRFIQKAISREKPDLVHAHWTYEFALGALSTGIPAVVTAHDAPLHVLRYDRTPYRFIRALMSMKTIQMTRFMTAVSPYISDDLMNVWGYKGNITVIPNGLPEYLFDLNSSLKENNNQIVFASNLVGWGGLKNGEVLIKAFSQVVENFPSAKLLMFGSGHGRNEEAETWAKERGISKGIIFQGNTPYKTLINMIAKEVDVLVHPSLEESFSMALAEAMALGVPVIGGQKSGGVPYTLNYGKAGLLVDMHSTSELSSAMVSYAKDKDLRNKFSIKGKQFVKENFSIKKVVDLYEEVYSRVIGELL